jgi:hypothetical protein
VTRKIVVVCLVALVAVAGFLGLRRGYVYEISQANIQSRLKSQFPVKQCLFVLCIELKEPFVRLSEHETRIVFGSNAHMDVALANDQYDGEAGFSGRLKYVRDEGAFYLDDSKLEYLKVKGLSEKDKKNLDHLAALMIKEYLRTNPVYRFRDSIMALIAPWLELKEVTVSHGALRIRLGLAA